MNHSKKTATAVILGAAMFAGGVIAAETVTLPKSVLDEILANQQRMQDEITELRATVENNGRDLRKRVDGIAEGVPDTNRLTRRGKRGVELEISGQVNQGVLYANSGHGDGADRGREVFIVDNDNSSTRLRWTARAPIDDENTVGARIEVQFESNSTADINQDQDGAVGKNNFTRRKLEGWWKNKRYGTFWLGHGDTASQGTAEKDLSGVSVIADSAVNDFAGGLSFRNQAGSIAGTPLVKDVFNNLDGLSLQNRVRYDTPAWHGTSLAASYVDGGDFDVGLHHAYKWPVLGGVKVAAGAAWASRHGTKDYDQVDGSISALHEPSGLNLTVAAGTRFTDGIADDRMFYFAKGGWLAPLFGFGKTALAADFFLTENAEEAGDEGRSYGLFMVQNIDQTATEIYLGYRRYEYWTLAEDFQDIDAVLFGVRQKF